MQPKAIPTENTQTIPLQIKGSSNPEIFTAENNKTIFMFTWRTFRNFLLEQTQAEIERLKLQNLEKNEAANQSKWKQELECKQLLQKVNQPSTAVSVDNTALKNTQMIPSTSKNYHYSKFLDLTFQKSFQSSFVL